MTTAPDLAPNAATSPPVAAGPRVRLAATVGLAGALLSFVGWALTLSNPDEKSGLWYAGSIIGELTIAATIVLLLGLFAVRETGSGTTGRGFLALWILGQAIILVAGIWMLGTGSTDLVLFPIGGITAGLAGLVTAVFIACNRGLRGSLRRWAPLTFAIGSFVTGFFQGTEHTLRVNLADLANNLLWLLVAAAFLAGVRRDA